MSAREPLYRKVNTRARGVHHGFGGDDRHTRARARDEFGEDDAPATRAGMHGRRRRGLDYTPLFRFLLARVGEPWDAVYSEVIARLDRPEPIFWLVALPGRARQPYVRVGESSYYSGLYVDDEGRLRVVDPAIGPETLEPTCDCCTHTFNGARFTRPFRR